MVTIKSILNEYAFTLIEALISLIIVGILSLFIYPFIINLYDYIALNRTITIFQSDLHYVRDFNMMSLDDSDRMVLRIYHDENRYVILISDVIYRERDLPNRITMPHDNAISNISFNHLGNLGMGRTFVVSSRYHERRVVFSIGIGGFEVR